MFKKFSLLLAVLFALSAGLVQAQTFNGIGGTVDWQSAASWTPASGASGFPGQAVNNGDVVIGIATTFNTSNPPALAISSLTVSAPGTVALFGAGTLIVTGNFSVNSGTTLSIPAGYTIRVDGAATIAGTIQLATATSRIIFNGAVTQTGSGVITAGAAASTVQLGAGVTSFPGVLLGTWGGTLQTGGAIALTSNLTTGAAGIISLTSTMTINSGVTVTIGNNNAATAIAGAGNFQGQSATSILDLTALTTGSIQGTWFANPYNGRLNTPASATPQLTGTITFGSTGFLSLGNTFTLAASANLILNNTAAGSLAGTGTIAFTDNTSTLTFGPGFNNGTIDADRIAAAVLGTINTGGNLTLTSTVRGNPILTIGAATGILNLTGTLTIAAAKQITFTNTAAGTLTGSGTFAAAAQSSTVSFGATANGATGVPGVNFSNPWAGTIITANARPLTGNMTIGATGILNLTGNLTVQTPSTLTLNQTSAIATAIQGTGLIDAVAGATVEIGAGTFVGNLPVAKLGTGTTWAAGTLRVLGTSVVSSTYDITAAATLNLPTGSAIQVASGVNAFTINGTLTGTASPVGVGRINGTDNTSQVTLGTTFTNNSGFGTGTTLPGIVFGKTTGDRAFDGLLNVGAVNRTLNRSLIMGPNAILNIPGAQTLTVNTPDTLSINMTAAIGTSMPGAAASQILGTGTVAFGNNALGSTYPGALPLVSAAFTGRIIVGDNVNFAASYTTPTGALFQLNGASIVNNGVTLTIANTAANSLTGTGTLQGQTPTNGGVAFNATANGSTVPGARFANPFNGGISTAGAMNLTGSLTTGVSAFLNLGGDLTLSNTSVLTLNQTSTASVVLPGLGKLIGQPGGSGVPEIVISTNAFGNRLPSTGDLTLGNGATDFGGRLTIGNNFQITTAEGYTTTLTGTVVGGTPFTVNSPASLNIITGATLTVGAGAGIRFQTSNATPIGNGVTTGTIQGANNTAIVEFASPYSANVPGQAFVSPFNGALVANTSLNLAQSLRMGSNSLLILNNSLNVTPNASIRLDGGVNTVQGTGVLNGANNLARIVLSNGFNGGTFPTARFGSPMNATIITEGAMALDASFTISPAGALFIGGNMTLPTSGILTMSQTAPGSFQATGTNTRFVGPSTSRIILGGNFNNRLLQGDAFTDFAGLLSLNSPMSLTSSLQLNSATSQLDLGAGMNCLALHAFNLSVTNSIQSTSATAFIVTNGVGALTINNSALSSVFFPIGVTNASYTPLSLRSTSGTADVFRVRVQAANPLTNGNSDFLGYVDREWIVSGGAPTVVRGMSITPQWAAGNERGTFLRYSTGVAAFTSTTNLYLRSSTSGTTTLASGDFAVSGNLPPLVYSNTTVIVYSTRPTYAPIILNPLFLSGVVPSSVPASNDPLSVRLSGSNLTIPGNQVVARHSISGVQVTPSTSATSGPELLLTFPGSVRSIPGVITISITNANTSFSSITLAVTSVVGPTITNLAPSTTASGRPFTLTVTGTGFFSNAQITINNAAVRPVAATNATTAFIEVPASLNATSNTFTVRVRNSDGQLAERTFTIGQASRPVITAVTPRAVFQNSPDTEITLTGTGFFGTGNVSVFFGSQLVSSRFVSSTQLVVTVPASLLTTVGNPSIIVSNSDAQNVGYVFSVLERVPLGPTPRITSVTPTVTTASFRSFSVNIQGENFNPSAVVTVLGQLVTVTRTGTTGLAVEIPAGLNTTTNTYEIVIQNPDLQFTTANVRIGDRLNAPTVSALLPQTTGATLQARPFTITIRGTNFTQDAQVIYNGSPLQIVSVSATEIRVIVPDNSSGMFPIVILNGDGQSTAPVIFNITSRVTVQTLPNISIYPSPVYDNMTISGGFAAPTTVQVTVTNIVGQRVMSFTEQVSGVYSRNVNMSELPTGAYLVEVRDGARRLVQKVVKY